MAALIGIAMPLLSHASAYSYNVIYNFCGVPNCANGEAPQGKLLMDNSGNLYGTTRLGGAYKNGAIFELKSDGGVWSEAILYSFCRQTDCPDGRNAGLDIMDTAGNLYGTDYDAVTGHGIAFELMPNADDSKWRLKKLHRFCTDATCADGYDAGGLTYDGARTGARYDGVSPLYGTTGYGGANGGGTAFRLVSGTDRWKLKTIYDFCAENCTTDAWRPGGLQDAGNGTFYAVSAYGGNGSGWGSIFQLRQKRREWKETVLYNFCTGGCQNGATPNTLIIDASGNFHGVTSSGGNSNPNGGDGGVVYNYNPSSSQYTVSYKFCSQFNCADGAQPFGLTLGLSGYFYGVTFWGGNSSYLDGGGGVVYALDPSFRVLHAFCTDSLCTDGNYPSSEILRDASGNLFGETSEGGAHNGGVVFELSP